MSELPVSRSGSGRGGARPPPAQPQQALTRYVVRELNSLDIFKAGVFTGTAFSSVFIISEGIPVFTEDMFPSWSESATRGIAIAIWLPVSLAFVYTLSKLL